MLGKGFVCEASCHPVIRVIQVIQVIWVILSHLGHLGHSVHLGHSGHLGTIFNIATDEQYQDLQVCFADNY